MKKSREEFLAAMKSQRFGVELEFTGISMDLVNTILADYFNDGELFDHQGRDWDVKYDGSIFAYKKDSTGQYVETRDRNYKVELVTSILEYGDIPMLQEIVRRIRLAGGVADKKYRTGLHIHISDEGQNADTLRNLIRIMSSKQYLLERALDIPESRLSQYCRYVEKTLEKRSRKKFYSMQKLKEAWNNSSDRYHMLNLSSMFAGKGIELRLFNGTLHAGRVKAYIQFSLALCQSAKDLTRAASVIPRNDENDKYTMRNWLCRLNLIGSEFKTCRLFMTNNLSGDSAFSDPENPKRESKRKRKRKTLD